MKKSTLPILVLLLATLNLLSQTNYYVSPSGNDNNAGTIGAPWKTYQKACDSAIPGSTVHFRAGTYANAWLGVSGTAGNFITFRNYNSEIAFIDGGSTGTSTVLIGIENKSYIRIMGLHFQNATGNFSAGVYIIDGSHHIEIINNTISNIHFSNDPNATVTENTNVNPIVVYNENPSQSCHDILIQGNEISNCRTGYSEALTLSGNVENFEVSDNMVHDITNIGIDIAGGYGVSTNPSNDFARNGIVKGNITYNCVSAYAVSAGIYIDGGQDVIVEKNTSYQNGRGFEIGCERKNHITSNITVRNNLSYDNLETGIGIGGYDYPSKTGKVINSKILNNSFYNNNTSNKNFEGELLIEYTENCMIKNNIFYATNSNLFLLVSRLNSQNISLDYNLFYHTSGMSVAKIDWEGTGYTGFNNYQSDTNQDLHSLFNNPNFINTNTPNLQLQNTSSAIDDGDPSFTPATGETDFAGNPRVNNSRVDMGAYEYQTQNCPASLNLSGAIAAGIYETSGLLTANGVLNTNGSIRFEAGSILLSNNFHTPIGSDFTAIIAPCANNIQYNEEFPFSKIGFQGEDFKKQEIGFIPISISPNPFSANSIIEYTLPTENLISISLYTLNGQLVEILTNKEEQSSGQHQLELEGSRLNNGVYLLILRTPENRSILKVSVIH